MKHARTVANYVILAKWIELQHEKNPASYLKSMQNVGFEQTSTNLLTFLLCKNNFFYRKKNLNKNHLSGHYW